MATDTSKAPQISFEEFCRKTFDPKGEFAKPEALKGIRVLSCTQYILGPFGPECDLKRFGQELARRGGKNARRRAVVAVARKLAVLLHHLWRAGDDYEPMKCKAGLPAVA